ncbi:head-tail adaptor protein [Rhizobium sp. RM]|uniref:head-tail adaptor protein n=1 Tax=Rhizobium sp. RM TaxID=2748079 RepID=UPI00110F34B4|nr:head-tail adaptor protein [Rhizobium sp. RM]NWJ24767.1 head-tail adaptor protein [Rhizobium sp. RM]TMV16566.1 head-tail adaptor protein [Rhizobium sp. Td3]
MTTAQELDRSITIERLGAEVGRNEMNEPVYDKVVTKYRAKRVDVSDGEKFQAGGVGGFLSARFTIRSSDRSRTIVASDQMFHDGKRWNIVGIKETQDGRNRFREITATAEND